MASNKKKKNEKTLIIGAATTSKKNVHQYAVADMKAGMNSAFWLTISEIIKANIEFLADQILTGVDADGNELTPAQIKDLRKWRNMNAELLLIPEKALKSMEEGVANPVEFDPYYKVYQDILIDNQSKQP